MPQKEETWTFEEWREASQMGEKCGMLGCRGDPIERCPICGNHYCKEHIKIHFHLVQDSLGSET